MTRTNLLLAGLALLGLWNRAGAETGPVLNPAGGTATNEIVAPGEIAPRETAPRQTAPSETLEETIEPGQAGSVEAIPAPAPALTPPVAPPASADRWRYQQHKGRWWYWSPDQRWFYWDSAAWRAAPPAVQPYGGAPASAAAAFGPSVSYRKSVGINPDLIPVWRGPPPRYGAPPFPGMQRYSGEPYMYYYGRLYRIQGAYANGFLQFSGPPASYYGGGNGRIGFPYYNNW